MDTLRQWKGNWLISVVVQHGLHPDRTVVNTRRDLHTLDDGIVAENNGDVVIDTGRPPDLFKVRPAGHACRQNAGMRANSYDHLILSAAHYLADIEGCGGETRPVLAHFRAVDPYCRSELCFVNPHSGDCT